MGEGAPNFRPRVAMLKEKEVGVHFPFMVEQATEKEADMADKFSSRMDESCLRAFAVFGPLRCLESAFSSFQSTHKETKYRGMFQQIFPCFTHISGLRTRIQDLSEQAGVGVGVRPPTVAGLLPLDESASSDSAAMYYFDLEASEGQGRADYVLRTIPKNMLEKFKAKHSKMNWDNPDKEKLARLVFRAIPDAYVRCDAILDIKTDSVSHWSEKTRAQLTSYGNQAAQSNLMKGFAPRPVYLMAIDATRWRLCILDPVGLVNVDGHMVTGFGEFDEQQKLRADWIKKKDPRLEGYFATAEEWTLPLLQGHLDEVNEILRKQNTSSVCPDEYVVSNLWDNARIQFWNGRGLESQLQRGTLSLCEGLLRLACGDKICRAGWTAQRLRSLFGRQCELDINRCLKFESFGDPQATPPRSLECAYSREVQTAASGAMASIRFKPSAAFHAGFVDSVARAKEFLRTIARVPATPSDLLKVGCLYGGPEILTLLDGETRDKIGSSIHHIVVDSHTADDSAECFRAMVISAEHLPKMPMLKKCKVLVCNNMSALRCLWSELYDGSYRSLVVFCRKVTEEVLSILNDLQAEVVKVVTVREEASLSALTAYLDIKAVEDSASNLANCLGDAEMICTCEEEVIVHHPKGKETNQPLRGVLELRVGGATRDHCEERLKCLRAAATAVDLALKKGVIPGNGVGLLAAVQALPESSDDEYRAGVDIVKQALKAIEGPAEVSLNAAQLAAQLFMLHPRDHILDKGDTDLGASAEKTLDMLARRYRHSVSMAIKRPRPEELLEPRYPR